LRWKWKRIPRPRAPKNLVPPHLAGNCTGRTNEILNESNEIAGLQKRLEMSGREVLLLQNELDNKIGNMSDRTLEMGQVRGVRLILCADKFLNHSRSSFTLLVIVC